MQISLILICLILVSIAQAALVTRIPKPKLSSLQSQTLHIAEPPKHKSPEERRKFSLFPKMYMKYVISLEPIYEIATHKPIVHGTKKPIMKKMSLLGKKNEAVVTETQQAVNDTQLLSENNRYVTPKVHVVDVSKEQSKEVVENKSEESKENHNDKSEEENIQQQNNSEEEGTQQNDNSKEEDEKQSDSNEIIKSTTDGIKNKFPSLKDLIFSPEAKPAVVREKQSKGIVKESKDSNGTKKETQNLKNPDVKPVEVNSEIKNIEIVDEKEKTENKDTPDFMEFIFIDSAKISEVDKNSSDEPEEYITTEYYIDQEIVRMKRGSNIIEEENLASTVAGYKYRLKDTRLNNNVAYKNIHS